MKGLVRNNLYAALSNTKVYLAIAVLLGIFVAAMDNRIPSLLIAYTLLAIIGFPRNSAVSVHREGAAKWSKYKLCAPVKRADIVRSYFVSQLAWLLVGMAFAGTVVTLSVALHGYPFDRNTDIFMLFVVGVGISLFMNAIFLPLSSGREESNEVFLLISMLCAAVIIMALTTLINKLLPSPMTTFHIILGGMAILSCGITAFALSYPLTVKIFQKREY